MLRRVFHSLLPIVALTASCAVPAPPPGPPAEGVAVLTNNPWRVAAVNGQATPALGEYFMRFGTDGRVSAKFGCNGMGGHYRIERRLLVVRDLAQTLMGCGPPAGTFEQQGSAILGLPMAIALTSNERLMLSNERGSIALDPVP